MESGEQSEGGLWGDYLERVIRKLAEAFTDEVTKEIWSWFI